MTSLLFCLEFFLYLLSLSQHSFFLSLLSLFMNTGWGYDFVQSKRKEHKEIVENYGQPRTGSSVTHNNTDTGQTDRRCGVKIIYPASDPLYYTIIIIKIIYNHEKKNFTLPRSLFTGMKTKKTHTYKSTHHVSNWALLLYTSSSPHT